MESTPPLSKAVGDFLSAAERLKNISRHSDEGEVANSIIEPVTNAMEKILPLFDEAMKKDQHVEQKRRIHQGIALLSDPSVQTAVGTSQVQFWTVFHNLQHILDTSKNQKVKRTEMDKLDR
jgi:hypothetical protein